MISQDGQTANSATGESEPSDDPRILGLMKEYEAEWEQGRRPSRSRFVSRYPDLASVIPVCLDGIDLLYREMIDFARSGRQALRAETGLSSGGRIGEFEIVREIGRGGMGVVYEAIQRPLNRRVAVKVLPHVLAADQNRLRRFEVEARATAAVNHPHIVPVYAVGEDRGMNFYAMRYVDGFPLDALIAESRRNHESPAFNPPNHIDTTHPSPDEFVSLYHVNRAAYQRAAVRFGAIIARALDHAHQNGVVHRDIKPANLLLDRDGHIWVADFGLAQFVEAAALTGTGTALGTLRYMSPEQASGDRRKLDHRTDIYSLAATLYELLTGQPVFSAEEPGTLLKQIAHAAPSAPRSLDPTIPTDLETVIMKGLEKDSGDRYTTAAEFADDLQRFLAGQTIAARRPSLWDRARKWMGRHPTLAGGIVLGMALLAIVSAIVAALSQRAYQAERGRAEEAERRVEQSKQFSNLMIQISEESRSNISLSDPRIRLLQAALENFQQLYQSEKDNPHARAELDSMMPRLEALLAEEKATRESWPVGLLWFESVRRDLELSPGQEVQLNRLYRSRGMEPGAKGTGLLTIRDDLILRDKLFRLQTSTDSIALRDELLELLTEPQRTRLEQLLLQFLGSSVFSLSAIDERLSLTTEQRKKIRLLQPMLGYRFGPPPDALRRLQQREGADPLTYETGKFLQLLTQEQRKAWDSLVGKPFGQ